MAVLRAAGLNFSHSHTRNSAALRPGLQVANRYAMNELKPHLSRLLWLDDFVLF
jgi:hypothetical protein